MRDGWNVRAVYRRASMKLPRNRWFRVLFRAWLLAILWNVALAILDGSFRSYGFVDDDKIAEIDETGLSFAVVINTFRRPETLRGAVLHYADTCGRRHGVGEVYVVWSEPDETPPDPRDFFPPPTVRLRRTLSLSNRAPVTILRMKTSSLNNRFLPIPGSSTPSVFMVDDDVRVDCPSLSQGFDAWKTNPRSLVGYYPRWHRRQNTSSAPLIYHTWPVAFLQNSISMILTKAAFLHKDYLRDYWDDSRHPKQIREYVRDHRNCEDIAMAYLVANVTNRTSLPVYVEGSVRDYGLFRGISTNAHHLGSRSDCVEEFAGIYGWELKTARLTDRSWVRHFPNTWWQLRPSNIFEWFPSKDIFK